MKSLRLHLAILIFLASCFSAQSQSFVINASNSSRSSIVIAPNASDICQKAATELQKYIKNATGLTLKIVNTPDQNSNIIIGQGSYIAGFLKDASSSKLDADGYCLKTVGNDLVIAGGSNKGALFAVYTFLENYLGYRLYAPGVMKTPSLRDIRLTSVNLTENPALTFRDVFYSPAFDSLYADWHKLTPARTSYSSVFGIWSHTTFDIMPPSKYAKEHPEYYIMDKKQQPAQINFSNPEVYNIVLGWLNGKIKSQPQYNYWSVGQEDNSTYCNTDECQKIIAQTGSPAGPVVLFANKIAQFFPKKQISTLAYSFSRKPPVNVTLANNLNIMFCANIKNYVSPYTGPDDANMRSDLEGWQKLTKNIFVWDYIIDYSAVESIYPNLLSLKPNLKFFINKGVSGYYAQGNFYEGGEFAELRTYLMAKLLWNADIDDKAVIDDFLAGFYGNAAPYMKQYILATSADLTGGPDKLTDDLIQKYNSLLQKAEASVKNQSTYYNRVRKAELPLTYSAINYYLKAAKSNPTTYFARSAAAGNGNNNGQFDIYVERFLTLVKEQGIKRMVHAKNNLPLYDFYTNWKNQMNTLRQARH